MKLHRPIVVFDAGIGSYAVVDLIRRRFPRQDILYVADRAAFPYGQKSREALRSAVQAVIDASLEVGPAAIVLASNAPTVQVFDQLKVPAGVALRGISPPIREAFEQSHSKEVVLLGVRSLIHSAEFTRFVERENARAGSVGNVHGVNASALVELVETGRFLSEPVETQARVDAFMHCVRSEWPRADVYLLSSTHLPWLRPFFERAAPGLIFLDPAQSVVNSLSPLTTEGSSATLVWVTESEDYPAGEFADMLRRLSIDLPFVRKEIVAQPFSGLG